MSQQFSKKINFFAFLKNYFGLHHQIKNNHHKNSFKYDYYTLKLFIHDSQLLKENTKQDIKQYLIKLISS
jgi:hypothetical protein